MNAPPREGWIVLVDGTGVEMSPRVPVVLEDDLQTLRMASAPFLRTIRPGRVHAVRVLLMDGQQMDVPVGEKGR